MSDQTNPTPATPPPPPGPAVFLTCSECRAPMRDRYYALNERPICAKCRPAYARKIARTDGPGAIWRVGLHGAVVAVIGVVVLVAAITAFPAARMFPLIPIGYLVGKRMMSALDGYSARRYQVLAVGLTYSCFFVGMYIPALREKSETKARQAAVQVKMQGTAVSAEDGENASPPPVVPPKVERIGPGPGLTLVLLLLLPFFAMLQFGTGFSAVGVLSLGYALYLAWKQTDGQGTHLELSGPFRVGAGPIPAR